MEIVVFILILSVPVAAFFLFRKIRKGVSTMQLVSEFIIIAVSLGSLMLFLIGMASNDADYTRAIDIVDSGYTPFASQHMLVLVVFFALSVAAILALWLKGRAMPPLLIVLALIFIITGVGISIAVLIQVSHNEENSGAGGFFMFLPVCYILVSGIIFIKISTEEASVSLQRHYDNRILNYLNNIMTKADLQPVWALILLVPVFVVIVMILTLLGQDTHAIVKVFTDTTTWEYSQKSHPPFLDHRGHYLCTVAACGDPSVVKPLRLGNRHGHTIIVNRQLQVANAFEQLVEERMPYLHRVIRKFYDEYGYPLSRKITSAAHSNRVYLWMKPLEYFFVAVLYLCCMKPEEKIARQYVNHE